MNTISSSDNALYANYKLIDPRDNAVRYVGMSKQPQKRLEQHIQRRYGANHDWIQDVLNAGLEPVLSIIEMIDGQKLARAREKYWIQFHAAVSGMDVNIRASRRGTRKHTRSHKHVT